MDTIMAVARRHGLHVIEHLQQAYEHLGLQKGRYPVAEGYAAETLSLPMYPELTEEQIAHVAETLKQAVTDSR